jgi:hypothetical protein
MKDMNLWDKYCKFYEKDFQEQLEFNRKRLELYFSAWKKTDLAKKLCQVSLEQHKVVPVTTYKDYPMLSEFGRRITNQSQKAPRKQGESFRSYYDRVGLKIGSSLNSFMIEPYFICARTTGTTGEHKWIANSETFWKNFSQASMATAVIACSDSWGETSLNHGDKSLNLNATIPFISGWGAWASKDELSLVPPIEIADNLRDMKEKFSLILKIIQKGEKISVAGGIGSIFYMICKYFQEPEDFYKEYYNSMDIGLKKILLYLKILTSKLGQKEKKSITEIIPLKGVLIAGVEGRLYLDFFKNEFNLSPLHIYGSTEAGPLMRGDPDRKEDLIPELRTSYLEFQTEDGDVKELDEVKKGEVYELVVTPFGSLIYRYNMEDLLRVIDFRDDGMPIFTFESRKKTVIEIYCHYKITPNIIVQALSKAGLRASDKWAVAKPLKPKEHLHFLMEKAWPYSEVEAENVIFNSLLETYRTIPHSGYVLTDYITHYKIKDPSEVVKVEYLKPGAFTRYQIKKAKEGAPMGQYKPPQIITTDKMDIFDTLRSI